MLEDYAHTQLRVKLAKKGVSQIAINDLFANFSLKEIETAPARINAIYNLLNENGNSETFRMIRVLIEFMIANKDTENFCIWVTKDNCGIHNFVIGEN